MQTIKNSLRQFIALVLALVCVIGLFGCDNTTESEIHRVIMVHSVDEDAPYEEEAITDSDTISELLTMFNSLKTGDKYHSITTGEKMGLNFYMDNGNVLEWCISVYEDGGNNTMYITWSNMLDDGNYAVQSDFNYARLIEIYNAAKD